MDLGGEVMETLKRIREQLEELKRHAIRQSENVQESKESRLSWILRANTLIDVLIIFDAES